MTRDQDIERVLERWFTEGPTQMPDRLFEYVDHIDRLPQRRQRPTYDEVCRHEFHSSTRRG